MRLQLAWSHIKASTQVGSRLATNIRQGWKYQDVVKRTWLQRAILITTVKRFIVYVPRGLNNGVLSH